MTYRARSTEEGKKLTAVDGFRVLAHAPALPVHGEIRATAVITEGVRTRAQNGPL